MPGRLLDASGNKAGPANLQGQGLECVPVRRAATLTRKVWVGGATKAGPHCLCGLLRRASPPDKHNSHPLARAHFLGVRAMLPRANVRRSIDNRMVNNQRRSMKQPSHPNQDLDSNSTVRLLCNDRLVHTQGALPEALNSQPVSAGGQQRRQQQLQHS